ncbi:MAG: DUF4026 domain-containing protein [Lachnospiraceae bacterium]|nr:DUF4026 domain-containing protein [Lachnospiraceae bacterium]
MSKPKSQMMAVPSQPRDIETPQLFLDRLQTTGSFQVLSKRMEEDTLYLEINYKGEHYSAEIYPSSFILPELYRCQHLFPDVDAEAVRAAQFGLAVELEFGKNPLISYHLQLKLIYALLPDVLAVLDDSSEKILSGHWVTLAAQSMIPPSPRYLFTAQAVSGEDDCVWLHTHGLNRCGLPELEVLNSNKETYQTHYNTLETLANRLLEDESVPEYGEPYFLAYVAQNIPLVITLIAWEDAVSCYPEDMLGGKNDREDGHNEDTCAIFVYPTKKSVEEGQYSSLAVYDEMLQDNPIYMLSTSETKRMKALAAERMEFLFQAFSDKRNHVLIKLGLLVDEPYRTDTSDREHIWFEMIDLKDGRITAKLTQEPYYIAGIHEGYVGTYGPEDITDWLIFTPERRLTPDDIYLLAP